jgi:hypothetical protein
MKLNADGGDGERAARQLDSLDRAFFPFGSVLRRAASFRQPPNT